VREQLDQDAQDVTRPSIAHGMALHGRTALSNGQALPPHAIGRWMLRERDDAPRPQLFVQLAQLLHWVYSQSSGHLCALHTSFSASRGHAWPPQAAGCCTLRLRSLVPPPHDLVQVVHCVKADTMQSCVHL
jgi:hypothetical protein